MRRAPLLLRADNADLRLTPLAGELGLVDRERVAVVERKREEVERLLAVLRGKRLYPSAAINARLSAAGIAPPTGEMSAEEVLRRPEVRYRQLQPALDLPACEADVAEQVDIEAKYSGYLLKQQREVERLRRMESRRIPPDFDFAALRGLRNEARQTLQRFRPATIGQAARLAGINPADIALLLVALERQTRQATPVETPHPSLPHTG